MSREEGDGGEEENVPMEMDNSDDDKDALVFESQEVLLTRFTDFLGDDTGEGKIPFFFLFTPPGETEPRRLAHVKSNGPASDFFFSLARELLKNRTLCVKRAASVVFVLLTHPPFQQVHRGGSEAAEEDLWVRFVDWVELFYSQSTHDLAFLVYQDADGGVHSYLKSKKHVHMYSFWHTFIQNSKNMDLTKLKHDVEANEPVALDGKKALLDFFENEDDGVGDSDLVSCKDVLANFDNTLNQLSRKE